MQGLRRFPKEKTLKPAPLNPNPKPNPNLNLSKPNTRLLVLSGRSIWRDGRARCRRGNPNPNPKPSLNPNPNPSLNPNPYSYPSKPLCRLRDLSGRSVWREGLARCRRGSQNSPPGRRFLAGKRAPAQLPAQQRAPSEMTYTTGALKHRRYHAFAKHAKGH